MNKIDKALEFATQAHEGQVRKYTGQPYIQHPIAVAEIVKSVPHSDSMVAAALLHDVVEDTYVTLDDIRREFGDIVGLFVDGLTDVSKPDDGNRLFRKAIDRDHIMLALPPVHTIKFADLIDNSKSIIKYDPNFAKVFMREMNDLLIVLNKGNTELRAKAEQIVCDYYMMTKLSDG